MLLAATFCLLFCLPIISVQIVGDPPIIDGGKVPQGLDATVQPYLSLVLLALTAGLSGSVYLCVLRYICEGCCKPVVVGPQTENLCEEV